MFHLDWEFLPVFDSFDPSINYTGVYNPALVITSFIIAILAAFVALSISGRIVAAQTGRSRWAWTSAGAVVDLVFMDCEMPVMDGFETTSGMRKIEAEASTVNGSTDPPHVPIVVLTAHALAEIREKCLRSGMDDFLVKPFDEPQIGEMLQRWIPNHERAGRDRSLPEPEPQRLVAKHPWDDTAPVIDLATVNRIQAIRGKDNASLFGRVVSQFADTAPSLVAAIRMQCVAGDTEAVWRAAHSLKIERGIAWRGAVVASLCSNRNPRPRRWRGAGARAARRPRSGFDSRPKRSARAGRS
jgi:CheY-like chemotaxis protein